MTIRGSMSIIQREIMLCILCVVTLINAQVIETVDISNDISRISENAFSNKGSVWYSGGLSFSTIGVEGESDRINIFQISPTTRFFPADHFMIGPSFSWTIISIGSNNLHQVGIGAEIGVVFNNNRSLIPYFRSGGNLAFVSATGSGNAPMGFAIPIAAGIMVPTSKFFAIQIEPAYTITFVENSNMNVFSINLGISGIFGKSAITVLQGISGITSLF